jgi:hypothetical protein
MDKMENAISYFDDFNKKDPNVIQYDGQDYPTEYFYALQLYNWVKKLEPGASEPLLLASRSQHIGRWTVPRHDYPEGKAGYLNWRSGLKKFHAIKAGELMADAGYTEEEIKPVQHIILKEQLKTDPEVQVMENALCLVFLQFQYEDFLQKHDEKLMIRILQKTWAKMSQPGRDAALALQYSEKGIEIIKKALGD